MAKPPKDKRTQVKPLPKEVEIHYLKTPSYRTYHVDGIFGGPTPTGMIYVEFFVQRQVTPQVIRQKVMPDGTLGDEISREGKSGIIREVEAGMVMDVNTALLFKEWLEKNIKAIQEVKEKLDKQ
jgi:hypothetical protein